MTNPHISLRGFAALGRKADDPRETKQQWRNATKPSEFWAAKLPRSVDFSWART
ncbi:MAG: hypothetical protein M0Q44_16785 [Methylobacter sp.]|nr:hypothetical protein [Methylobacter sp.]